MHTMYVDKPMRGHGLMQAIARVNRVFKDKPGGLVVDYIGIAQNLKSALGQYSASDREKTGINEEEAVAVLLEKYEVVRGMFHGHDYSLGIAGRPEERLIALADAIEWILEWQKREAEKVENPEEKKRAHRRYQDATLAGFIIDEVIADHAQSGVTTTLAERPEGKRLYDKLRHGDVLVVRWVDRLGRNYQDVTDTIRHFMRQGVVIRTVINNMTFDGATTDPMQMAVRDALIGFMAATAQAQAEATKEAQRDGIADARARQPEKYRGRKPSYTREQLNIMRDMLAQGEGASAIARATGLTRPTVQRLREDMAGAEAVLAKWRTEGAGNA